MYGYGDAEALGRWKDRVKEYICERGATRRGGLDQARKECVDKERWRLFCHGHPRGRCLQRSKASELQVDRTEMEKGRLVD